MAAGPVAALSGSILPAHSSAKVFADMWEGGRNRAVGLRAIDISDDDTLSRLVDDSKFSNNPARRTTIAARSARLLLEWLKPSSHIGRSEPTCLAITLTRREIVEFVRQNRQPNFASVTDRRSS